MAFLQHCGSHRQTLALKDLTERKYQASRKLLHVTCSVHEAGAISDCVQQYRDKCLINIKVSYHDISDIAMLW